MVLACVQRKSMVISLQCVQANNAFTLASPPPEDLFFGTRRGIIYAAVGFALPRVLPLVKSIMLLRRVSMMVTEWRGVIVMEMEYDRVPAKWSNLAGFQRIVVLVLIESVYY